MNSSFRTGLVASAVLATASLASAGVVIEVTQLPDPAPGLNAFTVTAVGTEGRTVASIASLSLTGGHQVWENAIAGASQSTPKAVDLEGTFWNAAWNALDTHFLIDPAVNITSPGFGVTEANDASNPASLSLPGPTPFEAFPGVAGIGTLNFTGVAPQVTLTPAQPSIDFLHVVVPANQSAVLNVRFVDSSASAFIDFNDFVIAVPEPSAMALLAVGGLGMFRRRRA